MVRAISQDAGRSTISDHALPLQAAFGDQAAQEQKERREKERRAASEAVQGDPNLVPLGKRVPAAKVEAPKEPIPEVEWWDAGLLQNGASFEEDDAGEVRINESKLTIYVEHPVPLEPPAEEAQPPPMPLPLTQKVGLSCAAAIYHGFVLKIKNGGRSRACACIEYLTSLLDFAGAEEAADSEVFLLTETLLTCYCA